MQTSDFVFTPADLNRWVEENLVTDRQVTSIKQYVEQHGTMAQQIKSGPEVRKGFNFISIAYYFGGFMILLAYTIFIGLQWQSMTDMSKITISAVTIGVLWGIGYFLKSNDYKLAGNLVIFAGTGVVPLLIYSVQQALGIWPTNLAYEDYYRQVSQTWVPLEIMTILVTTIVLWRTRFPLMTLLIGFWMWFLSMDLVRWMFGAEYWDFSEEMQITSIIFGFVMLGIGYAIQHFYKKEFSFWLYLFGHLIILGPLTALTLDNEGWLGLIYILVYLAFVVASVKLQSKLFLVFGAIGSYGYLCYLAFDVFDNELGFTFALASVGLMIVLSAVGYQKYARPMLENQFSQ